MSTKSSTRESSAHMKLPSEDKNFIVKFTKIKQATSLYIATPIALPNSLPDGHNYSFAFSKLSHKGGDAARHKRVHSITVSLSALYASTLHICSSSDN